MPPLLLLWAAPPRGRHHSCLAARCSIDASAPRMRQHECGGLRRLSTASPQAPPLSEASTSLPPVVGGEGLIISPSAVRKLRALAARAAVGIEGEGARGGAGTGGSACEAMLRVRVDGGGCSGFKTSFELIAPGAPSELDDVLFDRGGGAVVVVDAVSLGLIRGSTLHWDEEMMRSSFAIVNNPNSEASCGCGASFSAKESP